jgi:glutamate 5-kinase
MLAVIEFESMISHLMKTLTFFLMTIVMGFLLHGCSSSPEATNGPSANTSSAQNPSQTLDSTSGNNSNILIAILAAAVTSTITGFSTWLITRSSMATELKLLRKDSDESVAKIRKLTDEKNVLLRKGNSDAAEITILKQSDNKLYAIRKSLELSSLVRTYRQPVILVGPKHVGKTSLLLQWHAPWNTSRRLDETQRHYTSEVPV